MAGGTYLDGDNRDATNNDLQYLFTKRKFRLTSALVKIDANFPDGVTPIFSKMCNIKYLHDI